MSLKKMAIRKAIKNGCRYPICALVYDRKGRLLGVTRNIPRLNKKGGGLHAEMQAMRRWGSRIGTLWIFKLSAAGHRISRMDPCQACQATAEKLGIKIRTYTEGEPLD